MRRFILPVCAFAVAFALGVVFSTDPAPSSLGQAAVPAAASSAAEPGTAAAFAATSAAVRRFGRQPSMRDFAEVAKHLERLDSTQVAALMDLMEKTEEHPSSLFDWWLKRDPAAASAWIRPRLRRILQDGPLGMTFEHGVGQLVSVWARALPQEAIDFARQNPQSGLSAFLLSTALNVPTDQRDFSGKQAMLANFPPGPARFAGLKVNLQAWALRDPAAALTAAQAIGDEFDQGRLVRAVFENWPGKQLPGAFERYRELGLDDPQILSGILRRTASKDPAEAIRFLEQLAPGDIATLAPEVIHAWAGKDPVAALQWAYDREISLAPRYTGIYDTSRTDHNSLGRQGSYGGGTDVNPLREAFKVDPSATLQWIRALPTEDRVRLSEQVLPYLQPGQQRELYPDLSPSAQVRAAATITSSMRDAAEARAWVESLPTGTVRLSAWRAYGQSQTELADLPPGAERDAMLQGRSMGSGSREPEVDFGIVAQIGDPARRRQAFDRVTEAYTEHFPTLTERARKWIEESSFPEEWKQAWRAQQAAANQR